MGEVKCAVCDMAFEEEGALEMGASTLEHEGKTYWFCSPFCEKEFRAAPERYATGNSGIGSRDRE